MKVIRTTLRGYVAEWLATKEPETGALHSGVFTGEVLGKFVTFLGGPRRGSRSFPASIRTEIVAFRKRRSAAKLSSKTVNHDFESCADALFSLGAPGRASLAKIQRNFVGAGAAGETAFQKGTGATSPSANLRVVLDAADLEWRSMILFGLYTGSALGRQSLHFAGATIDLTRG